MKILSLRIFLPVAVAVLGLCGWFLVMLFSSNQLKQSQRVSIEEGIGINEISSALSGAGAIRKPFVFETYIWLLRKEGNVQAGIYEFPKGQNIISLTRQITSGAVAEKETRLTLIEGWTTEDVAAEVEKKTSVSAKDFLEAAEQVTDADFPFLASRTDTTNLEGYLFPDTYRIFSKATAEEILRKLLKNFDRKFNAELRSGAELRGKTIDQIVTMASILEREVKSAEDKRNAADVFWKRLDIGMPLQSDATVNYITKKKNTRASAEDLAMDSPYNTYRYAGLPPSPISHPGLDALIAAVNPLPNKFYYFLTKESGEAVFAETNEEHNQNKSLYLE